MRNIVKHHCTSVNHAFCFNDSCATHKHTICVKRLISSVELSVSSILPALEIALE